MFTNCLKLTKQRAAALILAIGVILAAAVILCSQPRSLFSVSDMLDASQTDGRIKYLASYGWSADPMSEDACTVVLPKEFDGALFDYVQMQKAQGYDFPSYAGLGCKQYTYVVTNYAGTTDTVYATLYVRGTRVIGGDIHTADITGFMHGIR